MAPTFCPNCSNALTIARLAPTLEFPLGQNAFECRTCPYQFILDKPYYEKTVMAEKKIDDVMGATDLGSQSKTEIACPNPTCDSREAAFYQLQIRSADEPPTSFYTCTKCLKAWRED
ncbi:putative rna polymerase iii subunit c11 [Phaeomoniella chlamydospora]|uniref:DNA-directed RNA polymerase subunit n=1 Tax=Phaeomoniella chlamydospora TaxID=158046 RepID=A0A0G2EPW3_PHACM|nr:putative rna polymerase iii subunit c11 [Phaeomoniella chlamydospora]